MILHTLAATPSAAAFDHCLRLVAPGDAILLLGDGVYAALAGTEACDRLAACAAEVSVLRSDAAAAGVLARMGPFATVDMDGFVRLSERFARQLAWY
jgi:tRNA 2-thiouridine synthesizing protein B